MGSLIRSGDKGGREIDYVWLFDAQKHKVMKIWKKKIFVFLRRFTAWFFYLLNCARRHFYLVTFVRDASKLRIVIALKKENEAVRRRDVLLFSKKKRKHKKLKKVKKNAKNCNDTFFARSIFHPRFASHVLTFQHCHRSTRKKNKHFAQNWSNRSSNSRRHIFCRSRKTDAEKCPLFIISKFQNPTKRNPIFFHSNSFTILN